MEITRYPEDVQGYGAFDGGKFVEQRPVNFPGEQGAVKRVGPLFYWAWGQAPNAGYIGSHPHQAFEILTYVIKGKAEHGDSLGTKQTVHAGGVQIIQAGSGVYHEEGLIGPDYEGFQIWFEPYLNETIKQQPTYNQYDHEAFPQAEQDGVTIKTIIGADAPVHLVTDAQMYDISVPVGGSYSLPVGAGRSLAVLFIRGDAKMPGGEISTGDFVVFAEQDGQAESVEITPIGEEALRFVVIDVPTHVEYPMYRK